MRLGMARREGAAMRIAKAIMLVSAAAAVCAMGAARAQTSQASGTSSAATAVIAGRTYELDIDGGKQWIDTNIDLRAGEKLHITSSGTITSPAGDSSKSKEQSFGPDGLARGWSDLIHQYAVTDGGNG